MAETDSNLPPHRVADLIRAREAVLQAVKEWMADPDELDRAPVPLVLALRELSRLEDATELWEAERRRAHLAATMHYIAEVGDRYTLCGLDTRSHPLYGWTGKEGKFLRARLDRGGVVCDSCLFRADPHQRWRRGHL